MEPDDPGDAGAVCLPGPARSRCDAGDSAEVAVGALYQASAVSLIRLAYVMLGDRPSAEDVVQEAFCGLYRRWDRPSLLNFMIADTWPRRTARCITCGHRC
jgi:DNA-directed RNA polymerase specialized sigma24 family protein